MRILIHNHIENAWSALRANKFHTVLTVLGIMIGVAGITVILSLMSGVTALMKTSATRPDDTVAIIRSGVETSSPTFFAKTLPSVYSLTEKDADAISRIANSTSAPISLVRVDMRAKHSTVKSTDAALIGTTGALASIANLELYEGQFIDEADGIVLSEQLAVDLFGTEHAVGNVLKVFNEPLTVVGVVKKQDSPVHYLGVDVNKTAFVPLSVLKGFTHNNAQIQEIILTATSEKDMNTALESAKNILQTNHQNNDYTIISGDAVFSPNSEAIDLIIINLAVIAGISLLVGGVSMMNTMLVNVSERRREVGIRRSVGATHHHIVNQFLIESVIISFVGGVLGYLCGMIIVFIITQYSPLLFIFDWKIMLLCIGASLIEGIIFGVYPAIRAAQKHPVESLRM